MPTYLVNQLKFHAEGAVVNWDAAARRVGNLPIGDKTLGTTIQLRWMLSADLGLPTEPFIVWSRPHSAQAGFQTLSIIQKQLEFDGGVTLLAWTQGPMSAVSLDITTTGAGAIFAFGASPTVDNIVAFRSVTAGTSTVEISAPIITFLLLPFGASVSAARGLVPGGYPNLPGWTQIEIVGLPVPPATWGSVGKYGEQQGLTGSLSDAATAAVARLTRGAPPTGWGPNIASGTPAPAWAAPNFAALVSEVNIELLNYLRNIAASIPPANQAAQSVTVPLPPPQNSSGQHTNKPGTTTQLLPLPMTYMAAATDAFLNLVLGFGTAYVLRAPSPTLSASLPPHDFMVTAHWEKGLDGASAPLDLAAVIPTPSAALAPATPANVATQIIGALRPLNADGNWRESVRLSWDRPPINNLLRTASCAAARVSLVPPMPALALMEARPSGGYRPIVLGAPLDPPHQIDPEFWRVNVMDREIEIPSSPGSRALQYGAATQDIYGQWSPWVATPATIAQPDLEAVRLANPKLLPIAPSSGSVCSTTLEVDIFWDWRIRSPLQITLVGRLFPAATHGDPPPNVTIPSTLDRSLSGGGAPLVLTFSGDTPTAPGATILPLTEDGESQAASFGSAQGDNRRYRLILSGLSLDFASTPFAGIALWAQGQERIAPNRLSPYADAGLTPVPIVTSTGDPRPPVVPVFHVTLGSIPDASGSSHVQIAWTPQPNAVGYFVYEANEADLLREFGLPEPNQKDTLDARLLVIRNHFKMNPVRRPFHRWNSRALTTTGTDIALPRGSTGIHLYVVLGVSAGQVESAWPAGPAPENSLIAIAAPHITKPAPPLIEVRQILDNTFNPPVFKAQLTVTTRPGPRPAMVELYRVRVDDAAKELDTMGPPLVRLQATSGPWTVTPVTDPTYGSYIGSVSGVDAPAGSWKRVWYRATAWSKQDDTRGGLPGRSDASNAAWVVLPPADGPSISPLLLGGGSAPPDITMQWTCASPLKRTPLGPHKISARASVAGAPPPPLLLLDTTLDALPHTAPATGSGIWITGTAAGLTTYRALIRRAALTDAVNFSLRVTDPLGRSASQSIAIASGAVDPPPDLQNLAVRKVPLPQPAHTVLTFTSTSPIVAPLDGPYVLSITAIPVIIIFPPHPSINTPLGSVPTKPPIGPPPAFYAVRSLAGPPYTYQAVTTANVKGFVVRITGPDGKFAEKSI